jgi:hypothetical protein
MNIKTKYSKYDKVWVMYKDKPFEGQITGIFFIDSCNLCSWNSQLKYCVQITGVQELEKNEENIFSSKEDLIKSVFN